jgi:hypothetical protein
VITKDSAGTVGVVDGIEPQHPFVEKGESYLNETLSLLGNERRNSKFLKWKLPINQDQENHERAVECHFRKTTAVDLLSNVCIKICGPMKRSS